MADGRLRELERSAASGDPDAQVRLVFEKIRLGADQEDACREVFGFAKGDVYGWRHPKTGTVHIFQTNKRKSVCGTALRGTHVDKGETFPFTYYDIRWFTIDRVTCRRCLESHIRWQHTVTAFPGDQRWSWTIPNWTQFEPEPEKKEIDFVAQGNKVFLAHRPLRLIEAKFYSEDPEQSCQIEIYRNLRSVVSVPLRWSDESGIFLLTKRDFASGDKIETHITVDRGSPETVWSELKFEFYV